TADGSINEQKVTVSFDYLDNEFDLTTVAQGHLAAMNASGLKSAGESLIDQSDCKTCHAIDKKVNGPSYTDIANRYRGEQGALPMLAAKVIKGGAGVWGETVMSAHPQLTESQSTEMVRYILSIGAEKIAANHPLSGSFQASDHLQKLKDEEERNEPKGNYVLMASYTDAGKGDISPITAQEQLVLRNPRLQAEKFEMQGGEIADMGSRVGIMKHNSYIGFRGIDLTDIKELVVGAGRVKGDNTGADVEVRIGSADGKSIGKTKIDQLISDSKKSSGQFTIDLQPTTGKHDLYFIFTNGNDESAMLTVVNWIKFHHQEEVSQLSLR
ncbi:MAG: carbohydrate-binding protein, partial [Bacteroidota bacterium]